MASVQGLSGPLGISDHMLSALTITFGIASCMYICLKRWSIARKASIPSPQQLPCACRNEPCTEPVLSAAQLLCRSVSRGIDSIRSTAENNITSGSLASDCLRMRCDSAFCDALVLGHFEKPAFPAEASAAGVLPPPALPTLSTSTTTSTSCPFVGMLVPVLTSSAGNSTQHGSESATSLLRPLLSSFTAAQQSSSIAPTISNTQCFSSATAVVPTGCSLLPSAPWSLSPQNEYVHTPSSSNNLWMRAAEAVAGHSHSSADVIDSSLPLLVPKAGPLARLLMTQLAPSQRSQQHQHQQEQQDQECLPPSRQISCIDSLALVDYDTGDAEPADDPARSVTAGTMLVQDTAAAAAVAAGPLPSSSIATPHSLAPPPAAVAPPKVPRGTIDLKTLLSSTPVLGHQPSRARGCPGPRALGSAAYKGPLTISRTLHVKVGGPPPPRLAALLSAHDADSSVLCMCMLYRSVCVA
jgi:hypothetical protein